MRLNTPKVTAPSPQGEGSTMRLNTPKVTVPLPSRGGAGVGSPTSQNTVVQRLFSPPAATHKRDWSISSQNTPVFD